MDRTSPVRERQLGYRGSREGFLEEEGGQELGRTVSGGREGLAAVAGGDAADLGEVSDPRQGDPRPWMQKGGRGGVSAGLPLSVSPISASPPLSESPLCLSRGRPLSLPVSARQPL